MSKTVANARIAAVIGSVALVGAGTMYAFAYIIPLSGNGLFYAFCTLAMIILGLAVPYWMLKLGFHEAHLRNPKEKELALKDIPKDKRQLARDKRKE